MLYTLLLTYCMHIIAATLSVLLCVLRVLQGVVYSWKQLKLTFFAIGFSTCVVAITIVTFDLQNCSKTPALTVCL